MCLLLSAALNIKTKSPLIHDEHPFFPGVQHLNWEQLLSCLGMGGGGGRNLRGLILTAVTMSKDFEVGELLRGLSINKNQTPRHVACFFGL